MYDMLYYSQDDKKVTSQEYQEMIKDYLGILLYKRFYKKYGNNKYEFKKTRICNA